jgi:hypothetical protein
MNKLYCLSIATILLFFLLITNVNAQIPNAGFENWTNGNPDDWTTYNSTGLVVDVTQSGDAHSGSSSAKLEVVNYAGVPYPAELWTISGASLSSSPEALNGYYKYSPTTSASEGGVVIELYKNGNIVGEGGDTLKAAAAYTQFSVPIYYFSSDIPDSFYIWIAIGDTSISGSTGSVAYFDDLSFGNATGIVANPNSPKTFQLKQNYPNPFNPTTNISYYLPQQGFVRLNIYDINGQLIKTLVDENQIGGTHKVMWNGTNSFGKEVASGVYLYRLVSGNYNGIKKMILMK